jgi:hypothetical protein
MIPIPNAKESLVVLTCKQFFQLNKLYKSNIKHAVQSFGLVSLASLIGCAKFVLLDRKEPPEVISPPPTRQADPQVPERIIKLGVALVQPEAWWNSCMSISVNDGKGIEVGCGKTAEQLGKVIQLPARKNFCNVLKVKMKVTTGCPAGKTCDVKSWDRSTSAPVDQKFFKFSQGIKLATIDAEIIPEPAVKSTLSGLQTEAETYTKSGDNTWIRLWFEDQTQENYDLWIKDKTNVKASGIDYNDYAVDLKGENVAFTVEGSGISCNNMKPQP